MKKELKFLAILVIVLIALIAMSTTSKAAQVATFEELKTALENDEEIETTANINVTTQEELDLKGKTLTLNHSIVLYPGADLTIKNGTIDSNAQVGIRVYGATVPNSDKTILTIEKDSVIKGQYVLMISIEKGSKYSAGININLKGTLDATTEKGIVGIYVHGNLKDIAEDVPVINVYDGAVIKSRVASVYAAGYAKWNIKGGSFTGTEALSIKSGKFNITGGSFEANGDFVKEPEANGNGSEATGSAISITSNASYAGNVDITISNADVNSENGYGIFEGTTVAGKENAKMEILSGNFSGKEGSVYSENSEGFISGGQFSSIDKKYISNNLNTVEYEGRYYIGRLNYIEEVDAGYGKLLKITPEKAVKGQLVTLYLEHDKAYKQGVSIVGFEVYTEDGTHVELFDPVSFEMPDEKVFVKAVCEKIDEGNDNKDEEIKDNQQKEDVQKDNQQKDETPKTGVFDIALYVLTALGTIALVSAVKAKTSKH